MTPTTRMSVAVVFAAAALAATAAHASAKPGTFAGSLGTKVPKGAEADVRAVNRATGTVVTAQGRLVQRRVQRPVRRRSSSRVGRRLRRTDGFFNSGSITVTPAGVG